MNPTSKTEVFREVGLGTDTLLLDQMGCSGPFLITLTKF